MGSRECDRTVRYRQLAIVFPILIFAASLSRAQDNYEIQVYGSDLVDPRNTMVELHSNFTIDGSKTIVDGVYPTNHAEHETVEITHGFNDRKVRVAREGMGKSGGARVVYIWRNERFPAFLITAFPKNEKANLSKAERNELKKRADGIFNTYRKG